MVVGGLSIKRVFFTENDSEKDSEAINYKRVKRDKFSRSDFVAFAECQN